MAEKLVMPELGDGIEKVDVLSVLVSAGDHVDVDDALIEVETEKATVEVPATASGTVQEVLVAKGDELEIGGPFLVLEADQPESGSGTETGGAETESEAETEGGAGRKSRSASGSGREAAAAEDDEEDGHEEEEQEEGAAPRRRSGSRAESRPRPDSRSSGGGATGRGARDVREEALAEGPAARDGGPLAPAAPSVRRLARELGVELREVPGSGPGGRISLYDLKRYTRQLISQLRMLQDEELQSRTLEPPPLPDFARHGAVHREPLGAHRRATAQRVAVSGLHIPAVTQHDEADVTEVEAWRVAQNRETGGDPRLTLTAIAVKIVALALRAHPRFNTSLDVARGELVHKDYVHVGVAVDTERGLLAPVLKDADRKSLPRLARELQQLVENARSRRISPEDLSGATFNVTNLGGLGTTSFTPLVMHPHVAVLGLGRARQQPVWDPRSEEFRSRLILPLSLTYDHRVIDGAEAARFQRWIASAFEQPLRLFWVEPGAGNGKKPPEE